jgi:hypothetical protein
MSKRSVKQRYMVVKNHAGDAEYFEKRFEAWKFCRDNKIEERNIYDTWAPAPKDTP